jgi:F-type H+-transporting ATPase subunit delta
MAATTAAHSSFDHFDHREMAVASVYAEAIYRLAEEKGSEEALLQELESVAEYLDTDAGAAAFFSSPLVDAKTRARLLEKAFRGRASELLTDSLRIVQRKGRLELLPVIVAAYRACHDQRRSVVDARVTSAVALSDAQRAALSAAIEAGLAKRPRLLERVDPEILGGLVIEVGGCKLDDSVAAQLRKLEMEFLERASGEIVRARGGEGSEN